MLPFATFLLCYLNKRQLYNVLQVGGWFSASLNFIRIQTQITVID